MNARTGPAEPAVAPTDGGDDLDLADALLRMDDHLAAIVWDCDQLKGSSRGVSTLELSD